MFGLMLNLVLYSKTKTINWITLAFQSVVQPILVVLIQTQEWFCPEVSTTKLEQNANYYQLSWWSFKLFVCSNFFIEIQGCHHHLPLFQTLLRYTNTISQFNQIFKELYLTLNCFKKKSFIETEYSKFSS